MPRLTRLRRRSMLWRKRRAHRRLLHSTRMCSARSKGARKILARLGTEASDPLDEFLESRADLRAARDAVAARLSPLDSGGAERGQARHGDGARRGARDDGARRQGAGSEERHSIDRHHDAAGRRASAAPADRADRGRTTGRDRADLGVSPRTSDVGADGGGARARRSKRRATNIAGCFMWR